MPGGLDQIERVSDTERGVARRHRYTALSSLVPLYLKLTPIDAMRLSRGIEEQVGASHDQLVAYCTAASCIDRHSDT